MDRKEAIEHGARLRLRLSSIIDNEIAAFVHQLIAAERRQDREKIFIPLKQAAHECGLSVRTVKRWKEAYPNFFRRNARGQWEVEATGLRRAVELARMPSTPPKMPPVSP